MVNKTVLDWPVVVETSRDTVRCMNLSKAKREAEANNDQAGFNTAWRELKRNDPAVIDVLTDPSFQHAVDVFGGDILVEVIDDS